MKTVSLFLISLFVIVVPPLSAAAENQMSVSEIMLSGSKYFGTVTLDFL